MSSRLAIKATKLQVTLAPGTVLSLPELSIESGAQVAITGKSGSGKSTVLNLISGLLPADSGELTVAGHDLIPLSESKRDRVRREHIAMVYQTYQLLDDFSALENTLMGHTFSNRSLSAPRAQAESLLESVGLADQMHKRPTQLSVGQRQRVAIARALIKSPPIILADEPTGALDSETGTNICALLQKLAQDNQSTLLFVTHDLQLANTFKTTIEAQSILSWNAQERRDA